MPSVAVVKTVRIAGHDQARPPKTTGGAKQRQRWTDKGSSREVLQQRLLHVASVHINSSNGAKRQKVGPVDADSHEVVTHDDLNALRDAIREGEKSGVDAAELEAARQALTMEETKAECAEAAIVADLNLLRASVVDGEAAGLDIPTMKTRKRALARAVRKAGVDLAARAFGASSSEAVSGLCPSQPLGGSVPTSLDGRPCLEAAEEDRNSADDRVAHGGSSSSSDTAPVGEKNCNVTRLQAPLGYAADDCETSSNSTSEAAWLANVLVMAIEGEDEKDEFSPAAPAPTGGQDTHNSNGDAGHGNAKEVIAASSPVAPTAPKHDIIAQLRPEDEADAARRLHASLLFALGEGTPQDCAAEALLIRALDDSKQPIPPYAQKLFQEAMMRRVGNCDEAYVALVDLVRELAMQIAAEDVAPSTQAEVGCGTGAWEDALGAVKFHAALRFVLSEGSSTCDAERGVVPLLRRALEVSRQPFPPYARKLFQRQRSMVRQVASDEKAYIAFAELVRQLAESVQL